MRHINFRKFLYSDSMLLFESNGFSRITDKFINFILKNKPKFYTPLYTGWTYNKELYSITQNDNGKKIYLYITDIDDANGFIMRKEFNNKVTIVIDKSLPNNLMRSVLQHELSHMLKLESSNDFDPLNTTKESISNIDYDIFDEFNISFKNNNDRIKNITKITDILYNFAPNELSATINGACRYINQFNKNRVFNILKRIYRKSIKEDINVLTGPYFMSKNSLVVNITKYIDKTHLLTALYEIKKKFYGYTYSIQLMICYLLNKYTLLNKKLLHINFKLIYLYLHGNKSVITPNVEREIDYVYNWISKNIELYKNKLYDSIYAVMYNKNLFLTDEDKSDILKQKNENIKYQNLMYLID